MSFWSAMRRKPEEEHYSEDYDDYEDDDYNNYEDTPKSWGNETVQQPIRTAANLQIVPIAPEQYSDASKIADILREMKLVVLNLSKVDSDTGRRLLDFISGVVYAEDGDLLKVATDVFVAAPYFVDLIDEKDLKARVHKPMDF